MILKLFSLAVGRGKPKFSYPAGAGHYHIESVCQHPFNFFFKKFAVWSNDFEKPCETPFILKKDSSGWRPAQRRQHKQ